MAYAALASLSHTLDQIFHHDIYPFYLDKHTLVSLHRNVVTILTFIETNSQNRVDSINRLEHRIIDAAYEAEDIIESHFSSLYLSQSKYSCQKKRENSTSNSERYYSEQPFCNLENVLQKIDFILEEVMEIKNNCPSKNLSPPPMSYESTATPSFNETNDMIGYDDDFMAIKNRIHHLSSNLEFIPIVGMGGIGKSTLAATLYDDARKARRFDRHIWVVVSEDYSLREILLEAMRQLGKLSDNLCQKSDNELVGLVYQELIGCRYLIVVDDVWSTEPCDDLKRVFPKETNGSRVLLTTRLSHVAAYVGLSSSPPHEMRFLSENQSWRLLEKRVFGKNSCPSQLEKVGKNIAKECRGLPLTIVVVAGLLNKILVEEYWKSILKNIRSREPTISAQCFKILSLSYERLPIYLKPCFLYVSSFPQDAEIKVNQLIMLWMVEGFVKSSGSKGLEEVANGYLDDLVGRNLLIASTKTYNGGIKTVRVHDILRDIGALKAQEERFSYHSLRSREEGKERRLSIRSYDSLCRLSNVHNPTTRSLFHTSACDKQASIQDFKLLRVLHSLNAVVLDPEKMVHLRFLAFRFEQSTLPTSLFKLRNLQIIIILKSIYHVLSVPLQVWKMLSLKHLIVTRDCLLEHPSKSEIAEETNLQTLSMVSNLRLNKQVVKMLSTVRKLGLSFDGVSERGLRKYSFNNLVHLQKLEDLEIMGSYKSYKSRTPSIIHTPMKLAFPSSLKKLNLKTCSRPWEEMEILGSLPNLEVLKLYIFGNEHSSKWSPVEGQFLRLKYLKLDHVCLSIWEADCTHFPSLEILILRNAGGWFFTLMEIPIETADIDTLKVIELRSCVPSVVTSAKEIQAYQKDMGNYDLQLIVSGGRPNTKPNADY